jgi:HTH-type transcriptional regulator / antitoxin HipB
LTSDGPFRHPSPVRDNSTQRRSRPASMIPYGIVESPLDVGTVIRARRKAEGFTQSRAAALCGVGLRFLSELERGKPTSEFGKVLRVLRGFGIVVRLEPRGGVRG